MAPMEAWVVVRLTIFLARPSNV
eukprot:COSAG01_NODE_31129_length_603_cov_1.009921_2_plen_22_part_01